MLTVLKTGVRDDDSLQNVERALIQPLHSKLKGWIEGKICSVKALLVYLTALRRLEVRSGATGS